MATMPDLVVRVQVDWEQFAQDVQTCWEAVVALTAGLAEAFPSTASDPEHARAVAALEAGVEDARQEYGFIMTRAQIAMASEFQTALVRLRSRVT